MSWSPPTTGVPSAGAAAAGNGAGAALSVGADALAGILNTIFGNKAKRNAQRRAYQYAVKFWKMQNEYNHPSAQMERMQAAGLNPRLIYGTGAQSATGNADSIKVPDKADVSTPNPEILNRLLSYANIDRTKLQSNNLKTQNDLLLQETLLKAQETANKAIQGKHDKLNYEIAEELKSYTMETTRENVRLLKQNILGVELDNYYKNASLVDRLKDINLRAQIAQQTLTGTKLDNAIKAFETELNKLGLSKNDPYYYRILATGANNPEVKEKAKEVRNKAIKHQYKTNPFLNYRSGRKK